MGKIVKVTSTCVADLSETWTFVVPDDVRVDGPDLAQVLQMLRDSSDVDLTEYDIDTENDRSRQVLSVETRHQ